MLITNAREPYGCREEGYPCNAQFCWEAEEGKCNGEHIDDDDIRCGHYVVTWLENFCVYTQGHWVKKPIDLADWQVDYLMELFKVDPTTLLRVYRWSLLGTPKKSGKTETAGWLGDYLLVGDGEPSPWVAVAASSDKQADLVFGAARRAAEWSPVLNGLVTAFDTELQVPSIPGAKLIRLSSKAGTNDGPSWHAIICDELHEWTGKAGRELWTVLTNGIGSRRQPLILQITTAGYDLEGTICGEQYRLGLQLAEDPSIDPRYLFWWYQIDKDLDWKTPEGWKDANPSWGITLPDPEGYLQDQLTKKTENEFKRYFLNMWTLSEDAWLPDGAWDECEDPDIELDPTQPLFVGIDGALKRDSFAIAVMQQQNDDVIVKTRIWENPYPKGHTLFDSWKLDFDKPLNYLRELFDDFDEAAIITDEEYLVGPAFGYDPHFIEYAAQTLEGEGLNMITVPQTPARMNPASERLYQLIMQKKLKHDGDAALNRQVHAATQIEGDRGWRVGRPRGARRRIDAATAMVIAIATMSSPDAENAHVEGVALW